MVQEVLVEGIPIHRDGVRAGVWTLLVAVIVADNDEVVVPGLGALAAALGCEGGIGEKC